MVLILIAGDITLQPVFWWDTSRHNILYISRGRKARKLSSTTNSFYVGIKYGLGKAEGGCNRVSKLSTNEFVFYAPHIKEIVPLLAYISGFDHQLFDPLQSNRRELQQPSAQSCPVPTYTSTTVSPSEPFLSQLRFVVL